MVYSGLMSLQSHLRQQGILISFSGKFSQIIIEELGEAVKKYLETEEHPKTDIFNVFSVFIEQTQNIKNYCESKIAAGSYDTIANSCIVIIGKDENGHYVSSGNIIENKDAKKLATRIENLIPLDKTSLKKLYKEKIKQELPPDSLGAGVGLIDIARKARKPLEYTVNMIDEQFSFFTLKVIV
ncbi:SiaB family protein kinase [Desulfotomaculum sp. 1211_IL3151]|uniref:SiaB family protein kinase n=1 Tax=Desulfotomaculum sp. 1211_IL3151 TaxID=3084055 RepID=UPI002FD897DA